MKIIFRIPYPKLILLLLSFYVSYLIFTDKHDFYFHALIDNLGYFGTFLAGIFLAYGFTFAPAVMALMIASQSQNIWLAWISGSLGALIGSYLTFNLIRISFEEEVTKLSKTPLFEFIAGLLSNHTPVFLRRYVIPFFAGIIVSTPLPDEFGVALISASQGLSLAVFTFVSFVFSFFGIFIILLLGRLI